MSELNSGARALVLREAWTGAIDDHVIALAWSPGGTALAAASVSGPIAVFDGPLGTNRTDLPGHRFGTSALSWSSDGTLLASAGQDGLARAWDLKGAERFRVEGGAEWVERAAWSPVGHWLATAAGKKLRIWDAQGRLAREYPDHPSTIADVRWKPRAALLAAAAYGRVALWSPTEPAPERVLEWKGSVLTLAWSPDGRYLATGDQDSTVHFWIAKTGHDLMMWGYATKVRELAWDSSGRYLATGGGAHVTVWGCSAKGPEGTEPLAIDRRKQAITALAFHPSAPVLAVGGADGRLRLWRLGKAPERFALVQLGSEITQTVWSPSGRALAAATTAGTVAVYSTPV